MPKSDRERQPQIVTLERANQAQLAFHQLCLDQVAEASGLSVSRAIAARTEKLVREFLADCSVMLPTETQLKEATNASAHQA